MHEPFDDSEKIDFNAEDYVHHGHNGSSTVEEAVEDRPLLFVDINLGEDQIERIVVYEGNTAKQLARDFSRKHGKMEIIIL